MKRKNHGFTLVELIVVLVILAILAAILVPALLGYIDKAREKQELLNAKACMTAIQAGLSEQYAINGDSLKPGKGLDNVIIPPKDNKASNIQGDNGDVYANDTEFARKVLETIDKKDNPPYIVMFAVGSNVSDGTKATKHEKYTVCYMYYLETENSIPLVYFNGSWTKTHMRLTDNDNKIVNKQNIVQVGPMKGKKIQYYIISNRTGNKGFWAEVKKQR